MWPAATPWPDGTTNLTPAFADAVFDAVAMLRAVTFARTGVFCVVTGTGHTPTHTWIDAVLTAVGERLDRDLVRNVGVGLTGLQRTPSQQHRVVGTHVDDLTDPHPRKPGVVAD